MDLAAPTDRVSAAAQLRRQLEERVCLVERSDGSLGVVGAPQWLLDLVWVVGYALYSRGH